MTSTSTWDTDLALTHRLADAASVVSLSFFRRKIDRWSKLDGSLATEADIAVEKKVRELLGVERQADAILGEEEGQTGNGTRRWIVDAIDGTVDFAAGGSEWGTLIALEDEGRIVVGVCDEPVHKRRYWAARDQGAFWVDSSGTQRRLKVTDALDLSLARSYVPPAQWLPDERAHRVAKAVADATKPCVLLDHPALQVAAGGYEVAVFLMGGPWDLAAPSLIVEEAGGRFTDLSGRSDIFTGTAIFSNGHLHEAVLQLTVLP